MARSDSRWLLTAFVEIIKTFDYFKIAVSLVFFFSILSRSANSRPLLNPWRGFASPSLTTIAQCSSPKTFTENSGLL